MAYTITPGKSYRPPLPHPNQIIPKVVLIVFALILFGNLFRLGDRETPPRPVRVSLAHVERTPDDPADLLRSGLILASPLELAKAPRATRVDFPMGSEFGALTYNAQPFQENRHLGEDLNGIGGQNSDLGDPVYAASAGLVIFAGPASEGWGNVVILQHRDAESRPFQTFYGHLDSISQRVGARVDRGSQLGTVGTANGRYLAHLHFEWRDAVNLGVGPGYSPFAMGRRDGEGALKALRGAPESQLDASIGEIRQQLLDPEGAVEMLKSGKEFEFQAPEEKESVREPRQ